MDNQAPNLIEADMKKQEYKEIIERMLSCAGRWVEVYEADDASNPTALKRCPVIACKRIQRELAAIAAPALEDL